MSSLRARYDELTQSQKRIAEAIADDPEYVAFATADKFAAKLGVSPSTIIRFAFRIGLSGYPELQERARESLRSQLARSKGNSGGHLASTIFESSLDHDAEILHRTIVGLTLGDLEAATSTIVGSRRVFVKGEIPYSVASYLALALDRMRGDVVLLGTDDISAAPLQSMTAGDALVAVSFAPYAASTLRIVNEAKAEGVLVVAITDTEISPIGQCADVVLTSSASGIGPENSMVGAMAIVNALLNGVARDPHATERSAEVIARMNRWGYYVLSGSGRVRRPRQSSADSEPQDAQVVPTPDGRPRRSRA